MRLIETSMIWASVIGHILIENEWVDSMTELRWDLQFEEYGW